MPKKKQAKMPEPLSNAFLDGYLECMLWSSTDNSDNSGGEPFDRNYSVDDLADEALRKSIEDCNAFIKKAEKLMDETNQDDSQHGHDFWLTRNGHGAGFWDRGYGPKGDQLSEIAKSFREVYPIIGDDGKIYVE